jgi:two-component system cell cycle response regulator
MNPIFSSKENRRWMLVDDNAETLAMLSALVENFTTATIECHDSPQSALAAFAAAPDSYELVITDFEMPGMDGVELCRRLRALSLGQKVFLTTGSGFFSEVAACHHGFSALLNKPFPLVVLQEKLAAAGLLDGAVCAA